MPTTGERHALLFLASIAIIGAGVRSAESARLLRSLPASSIDGSTANGSGSIGERALAAQLEAVDSARAARPVRPRTSRPPRTTKTITSAAPVTDSSSPRQLPKPRARYGTIAAPLVVNVNSATAKELERLPRVGPAMAARIVQWREVHGPFRSMEDLRHVRGIGPATTALLAPMVTF